MEIREKTIMVFVPLLVAGILVFSGSAAAQRGQTPPSFADLAEEIRPSVVNISATKTAEVEELPFSGPFGEDDPLREFFERFFGPRTPREFRQRGLGSGFIIDKQGFILTNNHVVEKAEDIEVVMANEKTYQAKIVGRDPKTDIALIKIDPEEPIEALQLGDSESLRVGDWVVAVGNPFGLGSTVTAGIVSAKYRRIGVGAYDDFIQTDASINPGNSGGPLVNTEGLVVGINTAIFTPTGGNIGIGFAIPINMAKDLLPQLKTGKVVRGWLGVTIQEITPALAEKLGIREATGALVADVTGGSPADEAGITQGDVIVRYAGEEIASANDLPYLVASTPVGKEVTVEVVRKGDRKKMQVEIGELVETAGEAAPERPSQGGPNLGLTVREITPEIAQRYDLDVNQGLMVIEVEPNSPAAQGGIRPGDLILELDQERIESLSGFLSRLREFKKGDTVLLLIHREGTNLFITVEVG